MWLTECKSTSPNMDVKQYRRDLCTILRMLSYYYTGKRTVENEDDPFLMALLQDAGELMKNPYLKDVPGRVAIMELTRSIQLAVEDYQAVIKKLSTYMVERSAFDFCVWAKMNKKKVDILRLRSWMRTYLPDAFMVYEQDIIELFIAEFPQMKSSGELDDSNAVLSKEEVDKMIDKMTTATSVSRQADPDALEAIDDVVEKLIDKLVESVTVPQVVTVEEPVPQI